MRITLKELKKYTVQTSSGQKLGKVSDIVLDVDSQMVAQYEVRSGCINTKKYLVNRDQVVRFEPGMLIVDDGLVKQGKKDPVKGESGVKMEPVVMREE